MSTYVTEFELRIDWRFDEGAVVVDHGDACTDVWVSRNLIESREDPRVRLDLVGGVPLTEMGASAYLSRADAIALGTALLAAAGA